MLDPQNQTMNDKSPILGMASPIPDKLYFSIGEVSRLCDLKPHVLRYWEQEFPSLKPSKRRGNRRYYQRNDVILIRQIRHLLYDQGFTIEGAKAKLIAPTEHNDSSQKLSQTLTDVIEDLESLLKELED